MSLFSSLSDKITVTVSTGSSRRRKTTTKSAKRTTKTATKKRSTTTKRSSSKSTKDCKPKSSSRRRSTTSTTRTTTTGTYGGLFATTGRHRRTSTRTTTTRRRSRLSDGGQWYAVITKQKLGEEGYDYITNETDVWAVYAPSQFKAVSMVRDHFDDNDDLPTLVKADIHHQGNPRGLLKEVKGEPRGYEVYHIAEKFVPLYKVETEIKKMLKEEGTGLSADLYVAKLAEDAKKHLTGGDGFEVVDVKPDKKGVWVLIEPDYGRKFWMYFYVPKGGKQIYSGQVQYTRGHGAKTQPWSLPDPFSPEDWSYARAMMETMVDMMSEPGFSGLADGKGGYAPTKLGKNPASRKPRFDDDPYYYKIEKTGKNAYAYVMYDDMKKGDWVKIFEIKGLKIVKDGIMDDLEDWVGLEKYLVKEGILTSNDTLIAEWESDNDGYWDDDDDDDLDGLNDGRRYHVHVDGEDVPASFYAKTKNGAYELFYRQVMENPNFEVTLYDTDNRTRLAHRKGTSSYITFDPDEIWKQRVHVDQFDEFVDEHGLGDPGDPECSCGNSDMVWLGTNGQGNDVYRCESCGTITDGEDDEDYDDEDSYDTLGDCVALSDLAGISAERVKNIEKLNKKLTALDGDFGYRYRAYCTTSKKNPYVLKRYQLDCQGADATPSYSDELSNYKPIGIGPVGRQRWFPKKHGITWAFIEREAETTIRKAIIDFKKKARAEADKKQASKRPKRTTTKKATRKAPARKAVDETAPKAPKVVINKVDMKAEKAKQDYQEKVAKMSEREVRRELKRVDTEVKNKRTARDFQYDMGTPSSVQKVDEIGKEIQALAVQRQVLNQRLRELDKPRTSTKTTKRRGQPTPSKKTTKPSPKPKAPSDKELDEVESGINEIKNLLKQVVNS